MKRSFLCTKVRLLCVYIATMCCAIACSSGDDNYVYIDLKNYSVAIELLSDPTANSASVTFTPDAGVSKVVYAIGRESDRASFTAGTYTDAKTVEGETAFDVTFPDLTADEEYTVFAVAYDPDGKAHAVASRAFMTFDGGINIEREYLSDISAGFHITVSPSYYVIKYAFGTTADRAGFLDGTYEGIVTVKEMEHYVANNFDLKPETDYVFYCKGYDRFNNPTILFEEAFTTASPTGIPDVTFSYENTTLSGIYTLTANEKCSKIIVYSYNDETIDQIFFGIYLFSGDLFNALSVWEKAGKAKTATGGGAVEFGVVTYELNNNIPVNTYVAIYDEKGKPYAVKKFLAATPEYDATAGEAKVDITFTSPTLNSSGYYSSTYTYMPNSDTFAFFFETITTSWLEEAQALIDSGKQDQYYIHEYLYNLSYENYTLRHYFWSNGARPCLYTENYLVPGETYVAVAAPMNKNGRSGWGKLYKSDPFVAE